MRGGMEQYMTPMGPTKLHVNPIFEISPLVCHYVIARKRSMPPCDRCIV